MSGNRGIASRNKKHTGAAFATDAMFRLDDLAWTGEKPRYYASSEHCERGFCPKCGSAVSARYTTEPDRIEPLVHAFSSRRARWVKLDDGLPQYPEFEPVSGFEV